MQTFRKRRAGLSATAGLSCCPLIWAEQCIWSLARVQQRQTQLDLLKTEEKKQFSLKFHVA